MDRLKVTFELDGLVLLHVTKQVATAYFVEVKDHQPLLIVPKGNWDDSSSLAQKTPPVFALEPWEYDPQKFYYGDLAHKTAEVKGAGPAVYDFSPIAPNPQDSGHGWTDLRWTVDMKYLTQYAKFPDVHEDPIATVVFSSGWILGRKPLDPELRKTKWTLRPPDGSSAHQRPKQWLTDGLTLILDLAAPQGRATLTFKDKSGAHTVVLKEANDGTDPRVVLSNMCESKPSVTPVPEMTDVAHYGTFLKKKDINVPTTDEASVRSPDATRCPPASFLDI